MAWIQTYSGVQFWPLTPRISDVKIEDIAHALSNICRFNGHCVEFYSVAQHSVLVARELMRKGVMLHAGQERRAMAWKAALLHDAAEAYLGDMVRPLKPAFDGFAATEAHLSRLILKALDVRVDSETEGTIKHCDNILLATEARDLMGPPPASWVELPAPREEKIRPVPPGMAKALWLSSWAAVEDSA